LINHDIDHPFYSINHEDKGNSFFNNSNSIPFYETC